MLWRIHNSMIKQTYLLKKQQLPLLHKTALQRYDGIDRLLSIGLFLLYCLQCWTGIKEQMNPYTNLYHVIHFLEMGPCYCVGFSVI